MKRKIICNVTLDQYLFDRCWCLLTYSVMVLINIDFGELFAVGCRTFVRPGLIQSLLNYFNHCSLSFSFIFVTIFTLNYPSSQLIVKRFHAEHQGEIIIVQFC